MDRAEKLTPLRSAELRGAQVVLFKKETENIRLDVPAACDARKRVSVANSKQESRNFVDLSRKSEKMRRTSFLSPHTMRSAIDILGTIVDEKDLKNAREEILRNCSLLTVRYPDASEDIIKTHIWTEIMHVLGRQVPETQRIEFLISLAKAIHGADNEISGFLREQVEKIRIKIAFGNREKEAAR